MIVRNQGNPSEKVLSKLRPEHSEMLKYGVRVETTDEAEWKGTCFLYRTVFHREVA